MFLIMRKNSLLVFSLLAFGVLAIWHIILGLDEGFYGHYSWWDIPSHVLGGLGVALFASWVAHAAGWRATLVLCLASALFVGIGWEIFEAYNHIGGSPFMSYWIDTAKDLVDDSIGGVIASFIATAPRTYVYQ